MQAPKNMNAQRQSQNLLHGCEHCLWNKIKKKKKKKKKKQENVARNKTTSSQTKK
jgi:predicted  nucleic acid-binding Zn-ribbon protein